MNTDAPRSPPPFYYVGEEEMKHILEQNEFWALQVTSIEWVYLVERLIRDKIGRPTAEDLTICSLDGEDQAPIYLITKEKVTAADLAERLGVGADVVESSDILRLMPLAPGPKRATVPGWGTA